MSRISNPLARLRHRVSGAIARGEAQAIVEIPAEIRRVYRGSTYWTRYDVRSGWTVTADGVTIAGPYSERSKALEALDAVAPVEVA